MSSFSVYLFRSINIGTAWDPEDSKPGPCVLPTFRALPTGQSIFRTSRPTPGPGSLKPPFICHGREGGGTGRERSGGGSGQTDLTGLLEFRETTLRHTNHCGPSGSWERRKKKEWAARVCSKRPSAAPGQALTSSAEFQTRDFVCGEAT